MFGNVSSDVFFGSPRQCWESNRKEVCIPFDDAMGNIATEGYIREEVFCLIFTKYIPSETKDWWYHITPIFDLRVLLAQNNTDGKKSRFYHDT